jgi:adenylate kinase
MNEDIMNVNNDKFASILVFGPPGSGKGTVGKILAKAGNHYHLSSGDIFRSLAPDSPAGKLFHKYADKGLLIPDEATVQIWHYYVTGLIATNRYFPSRQFLLLDGIPRTLKQAQLLDDYIDVQHILMLETDNMEGLIQRLSLRASIEGRTDDADPAVLKTRMKVYEETTAKVIEHYPKEIVTRINADQKRLEVLRDVMIMLGTPLSEPPKIKNRELTSAI